MGDVEAKPKRRIGYHRRGNEVLYLIGNEPSWELFENPGWQMKFKGFPMPPGRGFIIVRGDMEASRVLLVEAFGSMRRPTGKFILMKHRNFPLRLVDDPTTLEHHQAWYLWQAVLAGAAE